MFLAQASDPEPVSWLESDLQFQQSSVTCLRTPRCSATTHSCLLPSSMEARMTATVNTARLGRHRGDTVAEWIFASIGGSSNWVCPLPVMMIDLQKRKRSINRPKYYIECCRNHGHLHTNHNLFIFSCEQKMNALKSHPQILLFEADEWNILLYIRS